MVTVEIHDPIVNKETFFSISAHLEPRWKKLSKKIIKENSDRVYVVVGKERTGKSFFTFQQAKYIDPTFNIDRICFTPDQFLEQIKKAPPGSAVVFDEAFRGFSTKASLSKVNRALVQAMMEVGRRNLIIFIVLPSFSLLEWYIATHRSSILFYVYKATTKNGTPYRAWRAYNNKKKTEIYYKSKKNFGMMPYITTKLRDRFYVKNIDVDGKRTPVPYETFDIVSYENKKGNAFEGTSKEEIEDGRMTEERRIFLSNWFWHLKSKEGITQEKFAQFIEPISKGMTQENISMLLNKTRKEGKIITYNK